MTTDAGADGGRGTGALRRVILFAVRLPWVVLAAAAVLLGAGALGVYRAPVDVFPEFAPPEVVVQTRAPGLSPGQVERLVSRPLESAVNGVEGLALLRSSSVQGYSVITAVFRDGQDIYRVRQQVAERVAAAAADLPAGTLAPRLAPLTTSTSLVLIAGLSSRTLSLRALRSLVDFEIKPRLLAVPGVSKVVVFGGEVKQLQIRPFPAAMRAYGLGFGDIERAASRSTGVFGAGFLDTPNQRVVLRSRGQATTAAALAGVVLRRSQGLTVTLGDVASVKEGSAPQRGCAQFSDRRGTRPGIALDISGQYGSNTLAVARGLGRAFKGMAPMLRREDVALDPTLFRPAAFIQRSLADLRRSLLWGGLLVALVLALFLWDFRVALISLSAIPLSLVSAVLLLRHFGIGLNTMTLGGLAIAIGEVVDDAIIDIENIHRRLGLNGRGSPPLSKARVVLDASLEVRSSVVFATMVVALVFLPVVRLGGVEGRLFSPLAWAYIFAILSSLLVALTVTPALAVLFLDPKPAAPAGRPAIARLKRGYLGLLAAVVRRPAAAFGLAGLALAASLAVLPLFDGSFLPVFNEGHFIVHLSLAPGSSLRESLRMGRKVAQRLLAKIPEVRAVSQQAGEAAEADDTHGTHQSELQVSLRPLRGESTSDVQARINAVLVPFPGAVFSVQTPLTERMGEIFSGSPAQVAVTIFGDDLDALDREADRVAALLAGIKGARGVQVASRPSAPELDITLRPGRMRQDGFRPGDVLQAVSAAYQGAVVAQAFDRGRAFDVVVILAPGLRRDPAQVGELPLRNGDGDWALLKDLARIKMVDGRAVISHENGLRVQTVTCDVSGRGLQPFVAELKSGLAAVPFTGASYAEVRSTDQGRRDALARMLSESLMAAVGVGLLLWFAFGGGRNALLALCNMPFALVGGVLAAFAGGGTLSLGSMVGFVTLFGITLRNSIMLLSHYRHLVEEEGQAWNLRTALRGAEERLLPIVMTAMVAGLGLLPIALGSGAPGQEIEGPMATIILGGLASSTAMNLLLLPVLALRFGRFGGKPGPVTN